MSEPTRTRAAAAPRLSLETWAVAASVIFIALIVAGVFPHVSW